MSKPPGFTAWWSGCDDDVGLDDALLSPSLFAPSLHPQRRIRNLLPIQRDLLGRIETEDAATAGGIRLGVGSHGHAGAVAEEDVLAVDFVGRLGEDGLLGRCICAHFKARQTTSSLAPHSVRRMEVFRCHLAEQLIDAELFRRSLHGEPRGTHSECNRISLFDLNLLRDGERDAQSKTVPPFLKRSGHVSTLRPRGVRVNRSQPLKNASLRRGWVPGRSPLG